MQRLIHLAHLSLCVSLSPPHTHTLPAPFRRKASLSKTHSAEERAAHAAEVRSHLWPLQSGECVGRGDEEGNPRHFPVRALDANLGLNSVLS